MPPPSIEDTTAADKRPRRGGPKSKTGCNTCKIRRIKCDETRPACLKCTRSGWTCPGFPISKSANSPPRRLEPSQPQVVVASSLDDVGSQSPEGGALEGALILPSNFVIIEDDKSILRSFKNPLLDFPGTREEHRFFEFFKSQTVHDLEIHAGFTNLFTLISRQQLGLKEKPIRHAILALAATHEDRLREIETGRTVNKKFALTHYNKAIKSLNQQLTQDKTSHQLTLIMCLLFTNLEGLNASPSVAFTHVKSGAALLNSYVQRFGTGSMDEIDRKLSLTYAGYRTGGIASYPASDDEFYMPMADSKIQVPTTEIRSIDEANERLNNLIGWSFEPEIGTTEGENSISDKETDQRRYMIDQLENWAVLLGRYMTENLSKLTMEDLRMIRILRTHNVMAIIENYGIITGESMEFDNHTEKFETIVRLSEKIIEYDESCQIPHQLKPGSNSSLTPSSTNSQHSETSEKTKGSAYQFEMSHAYPLSFVGEKCRHPVLRRRATELLHRMMPHDDKAGFFERIMLKVIDFEESQCLQPVTEDRSTWPNERQRIQETYHLPILDHVRKTQSIMFEWQPDGPDTKFKYHIERVCNDDAMYNG